jgi:uncharacterized protein YeaO (DUF488 family)
MVVQGPRGIRAGYGRRVEIRLKRIYDEPDREDGTRILADRLWARGITKERARIALWAKDVAPSTELRKWYDHDPERFEEFEARYRAEVDSPRGRAALDELLAAVDGDTLTLLTSAKVLEISHLAVLEKLLREGRKT